MSIFLYWSFFVMLIFYLNFLLKSLLEDLYKWAERERENLLLNKTSQSFPLALKEIFPFDFFVFKTEDVLSLGKKTVSQFIFTENNGPIDQKKKYHFKFISFGIILLFWIFLTEAIHTSLLLEIKINVCICLLFNTGQSRPVLTMH